MLEWRARLIETRAIYVERCARAPTLISCRCTSSNKANLFQLQSDIFRSHFLNSTDMFKYVFVSLGSTSIWSWSRLLLVSVWNEERSPRMSYLPIWKNTTIYRRSCRWRTISAWRRNRRQIYWAVLLCFDSWRFSSLRICACACRHACLPAVDELWLILFLAAFVWFMICVFVDVDVQKSENRHISVFVHAASELFF